MVSIACANYHRNTLVVLQKLKFNIESVYKHSCFEEYVYDNEEINYSISGVNSFME
jgi:hypothetical protein